MSIRLGDEAPNFTAVTTDGDITFHDWKQGSWAILFSHPADFTPVCTTELGRTAALKDEFAKRNTKAIAVSVDPIADHQGWAPDIGEVGGTDLNFPIIADPDRTVSELYDMIHPGEGDTSTVRSVFVIDPANKVRLTLTYPKSVGRNFDELVRVVDSAPGHRRRPDRDAGRLASRRSRHRVTGALDRGRTHPPPERRRSQAVPALGRPALIARPDAPGTIATDRRPPGAAPTMRAGSTRSSRTSPSRSPAAHCWGG